VRGHEPLGAQPARRRGAQPEEQIGERSGPQTTHRTPRETRLNGGQHRPGVHQRFGACPQDHFANVASTDSQGLTRTATQLFANDPFHRRGALRQQLHLDRPEDRCELTRQ